MPLESRLPELLKERGMTQKNLIDAGIDPGTVTTLMSVHLRTDGKHAIQFNSLLDICRIVRCQVTDFLVVVEPRFVRFIREVGGRCTIVLGVRRYELLDPVREGGSSPNIGLWDVRALAEISSQLSWPKPKIVEAASTLAQAHPRLPMPVDLLRRSPGTVIALGSPLVSPVADVILLENQQILRQQGGDLLFQFVWGHQGADNRPYHRYVNPTAPQGLKWLGKPLIQFPSWRRIEEADTGYTYSDAALLMVVPTNRHDNGYLTYVILVSGFSGPGTMAGSSFMLDQGFGDLLEEYKRNYVNAPAVDSNTPVPPLCVALRVPCTKTGGPGSREVEPDVNQLEVVATYPKRRSKSEGRHDTD